MILQSSNFFGLVPSFLILVVLLRWGISTPSYSLFKWWVSGTNNMKASIQRTLLYRERTQRKRRRDHRWRSSWRSRLFFFRNRKKDWKLEEITKGNCYPLIVRRKPVPSGPLHKFPKGTVLFSSQPTLYGQCDSFPPYWHYINSKICQLFHSFKMIFW